MDYIYLSNIKGHFSPIRNFDNTSYNLLIYFLTIEVNNIVKPWIDFLNNTNQSKICGYIVKLQKDFPQYTNIYWRTDVTKKHGLSLNTEKFILFLNEWHKVCIKKPRGILIECSQIVSVIPDFNGNEFQIFNEELVRYELHDDYAPELAKLCIKPEQVQQLSFFQKESLKYLVHKKDIDCSLEDRTNSEALATIEDFLDFTPACLVDEVKEELKKVDGHFNSNSSSAWREGDFVQVEVHGVEDDPPTLVPFDKFMNLLDQWKAVGEIPLDTTGTYIFCDGEYNFFIKCIFSSKQILTTLDLEKLQNLHKKYLYTKNTVQSIYFSKQDSTYQPSTPYLSNNFDCLALLLARLDTDYWKTGLADTQKLTLEDDFITLTKNGEYIVISEKAKSNTYTLKQAQFYTVLSGWYHAAMQNPKGILLLFKNDKIRIIPDFECDNIKSFYQTSKLQLPAEKLYKKQLPQDGPVITRTWPEDMTENCIESKIQEAFDYIKLQNIQPIWDPYMEINNFYGYTSDNLLIQFILDENMHYITSVPIFL